MKKYKIIFPALLSAIILWLVFRKVNIDEIYNSLLASNKLFLIAAIVIFLSAIPIFSLRWKKLLNLSGVNIKFSKILKLYLASLPISKISPSNSGDLIRSYYTDKEIPLSRGMSIIIFENFIDIATLSCLAIIGGLILYNLSAIIAGLIFLSLIVIFYLIGPKVNLSIRHRWQDKINDFFSIARKLFKFPKTLIAVTLYSLIIWVVLFTFFCISFLAFGENVGLDQIFIKQPIAVLLGLLPITISGIGVRESTMLILYAGQASSPAILSVGLIHSFMALCVLPIIGLPFLFKIIKHKNSYVQQ